MTTTTCAATNCDRPTHTYLCTGCTRDLQAWIDKVPDLFRDLYDTMARTDNVRPANVGANKGGKEIIGSPAPLNLDAYQLRANLSTVTKTAHEYAQDPHAGGMLELLIDWCQKAELLISGPEQPSVDLEEAAARVSNDIPADPLRPGDLALWLRTVHKLKVYPFNIRKWAERGDITVLHVQGRKTAHYDAGEVLAVARHKALAREGRNP